MAVVRSWRNSGLELLKKNVQEAQEILGEPALVVSMYHSQNAGNQPRCKYCYDDVYGQSSTSGGICPHCFGTSYEGGVRALWLCPIVVSNPEFTQQYNNRGQMAEEWLNVQFPDYVETWQNDFLLRLNGWETIDNIDSEGQYVTMRPMISRAYQLDTPTPIYLKDGNGYTGTKQRVGTKAQCAVVNTEHPIANLCLSGIPLDTLDFSMDIPVPEQNQNGALYLPYVNNVNLLNRI